MYENNNGFYSSDEGYRYEGGGPNGNHKNNRRRGWLVALVVVAVLAVVPALSIWVYAAVTDDGGEPDVLEVEGSTQDNQQQQAPDTSAQEGTSEEYALATKTASGSEMTPEEVSETVTPSVVCIQNYRTVSYQTQGGMGYFNMRDQQTMTSELKLYSEGSGIVLTSDGYIVTNAHVVDGAEILKVVLSDDTICEATLIGADSDTDIAVIKIECDGLKPAELGDSDEINVGQYVMAIGNPGGLEFSNSVTLGIVSAKDRPLELEKGGYTMSTIQTDAAINPGNSGGALVNLNGQVVGICSAKYAATGYEGLGFAITINEAIPIINDLMDYGSVQNRSMLGVTGTILNEVTAKYYNLTEGFYVYSVTNSNAGGLVAGDVITKVNGIQITTDSNVKNAIKNMAPGTQVEVAYYRSSDQSTGTVQLTLVPYENET